MSEPKNCSGCGREFTDQESRYHRPREGHSEFHYGLCCSTEDQVLVGGGFLLTADREILCRECGGKYGDAYLVVARCQVLAGQSLECAHCGADIPHRPPFVERVR